MLLSEAMSLGFALVKFDPDTWMQPDGSCGCALGGAVIAVGQHEAWSHQIYQGVNYKWIADTGVIRKLWPWLTAKHIEQISEMAWQIKEEKTTREQLLTYVRSIEPAEPSIFDLPDLPLEEQHRQEEEAAQREGELTEASGYPDPAYEVRR